GCDMWCCPATGLLVTREVCAPGLLANGINWDALKRGLYGHRLQVWDLEGRARRQVIDLGADHQMVLRLTGATNQTADCYGFAGVFVNTKSLSSSVWCWYRRRGQWTATKVIEVPPEPSPARFLPPALAELGAVPPLIT